MLRSCYKLPLNREWSIFKESGEYMAHPLEKEFKYYLEHQNELVEKYNGKYVVIKDCEVVGSFNDIAEAVETTSKTYALGTFLVQRCSPGDQDYTAIFHSRVA